MEALYHKRIGFPEIDKPTGRFTVKPSAHARKESNKDAYGGFRLPTKIKLTESMYERIPKEATGSMSGDEQTLPHVFEIGVTDGKVTKVCARTGHTERRDIILVIDVVDNVIITAWTCIKAKIQINLDEDKYDDPTE